MLFQKLWIEKTPDSNGAPVEKWYMILRTYEDVLKYIEVDADLCTQALLSIPASIERSHLEGSRERVLNVMMQTRAGNLKEGERLSPINVLADLIDGKAKSMLSLIERGHTVLVQQGGGYCTYDVYVKTWNAKITSEIEKDSIYFPTNNEPIETEILLLENGERVPVDFERQVHKIVGYNYNSNWSSFNDNRLDKYNKIDISKKVLYKITQLKLRDPEFVKQMLVKAKTIAFESSLTDTIQIDNMFKLFSVLPNKRVIIKTEFKEDITKHELFESCNNIHNIIFI